jgi:DNA-binding NarL/FixJ family response regulator
MQILFADDHSLIRESISEQMRRFSAGTSIIEVGTLDDALKAFGPEIDLVLLDLQMPGMAVAGGKPVVVLSGFTDKRTISALLERGASGFIPKTATAKTLQRALQAVMEGEKYIPSLVLDGEDGPSPFDQNGRGTSGIAQDSPFRRLTERESEILKLLIAGKSNKQIGLDLKLQEITVKIHLRNAYRKIGASNRADAVRLSYEHGFAVQGVA